MNVMTYPCPTQLIYQKSDNGGSVESQKCRSRTKTWWNYVITVPGYVPDPNGARPSATVMATANNSCFYIYDDLAVIDYMKYHIFVDISYHKSNPINVGPFTDWNNLNSNMNTKP